MKRILWVSRHEMTGEQQADLCRAMGSPVQLVPWRDTVTKVEDLIPALQTVDGAAVVLPPELLAQLVELARDKPVLLAASHRVATGRMLTLPDGRREREYALAHREWRQILRFELETRRL